MSIDADFSYPRESVEYVFFKQLTIDGQAPSGVIEYAMTRGSVLRPEEDDWGQVVSVSGKYAFLLPGNLEPGSYKVWVRPENSPEMPVIEAGYIRIT